MISSQIYRFLVTLFRYFIKPSQVDRERQYDKMIKNGPRIIYDGKCPFCSSYVELLRLRATFGEVELIDARERQDLVEELSGLNMDLDEGMVLVLNGEYFHGSECIHRLALLATASNTFNTVNKFIFERKRLAAILYPILRFSRNLSLKLLGINKIQI